MAKFCSWAQTCFKLLWNYCLPDGPKMFGFWQLRCYFQGHCWINFDIWISLNPNWISESGLSFSEIVLNLSEFWLNFSWITVWINLNHGLKWESESVWILAEFVHISVKIQKRNDMTIQPKFRRDSEWIQKWFRQIQKMIQSWFKNEIFTRDKNIYKN